MEKETTITIDGKVLRVKQSFRALMMFEEITKRSVYQMNESVNDIITLFYCILKANNKDAFTYTFDQFVDLIDEAPESIDAFNSYLASNANAEASEKPSKKKIS
jgi:hypothetical protein